MNRVNSCHSDSSGFLEEPLEPPPLQVKGHFQVEIRTEGKISLKCPTTIRKGNRCLEDTLHRHPRDAG